MQPQRMAYLSPRPGTRVQQACLLIAALGLCEPVSAQPAQQEAQPPPQPPRSERVFESAGAGMFALSTMAPRTDSQRSFMRTVGGYDTANDSAAFEATADVTVYGPVALRVGVDYGDRPDSEARPSGGLRLQTLRQEKHGVDMSLGAFYRPEGFTEAEGEIEGVVAFGRRINRWLMLANLVYGQDPEGHERDGEIRLSAQYQVRRALQVGVDSRLRVNLSPEEEQADEEEAGEPEFDLLLTPTLVYSFGWVCLIANAGFHGVQTQQFHAGFIGVLGLGGSI